MAAEKIEVIKIEEFRSEFKEVYVPYFVQEVIKQTDKRYFTRNVIYLFVITALTSILTFGWQNINMLQKIKEMEAPHVCTETGADWRRPNLPKATK